MRTVLLFFLVLFYLHAISVAQEIVHSHSIHHAFVENKGQWHDQVLFKSKFDGGNLWVQQKKMVFHLQDYSEMHAIHTASKDVMEMPELRQTVVHLNFVGANDITQIEKSHSTEQYYNYFIGNFIIL